MPFLEVDDNITNIKAKLLLPLQSQDSYIYNVDFQRLPSLVAAAGNGVGEQCAPWFVRQGPLEMSGGFFFSFFFFSCHFSCFFLSLVCQPEDLA